MQCTGLLDDEKIERPLFGVRDEGDSLSTFSASKTGQLMKNIESFGTDFIKFLDMTASGNDFLFDQPLLVEQVQYISRKDYYTGWSKFRKNVVELQDLKKDRKILEDPMLESLLIDILERDVFRATAENGLKVDHPNIVADFRDRLVSTNERYFHEIKSHPILKDFVVILHTFKDFKIYSSALFERFGSDSIPLSNGVFAQKTDEEAVYNIIVKDKKVGVFKILALFNFLENLGASTFPHIFFIGTKVLNGRGLTIGGNEWGLTDQICPTSFKTSPESIQYFRLCNSRGYKIPLTVYGSEKLFQDVDKNDTM